MWRRGVVRLQGWRSTGDGRPRRGKKNKPPHGLRAGVEVVPAGRRRSIGLLHDELADGVLLLARDADEVGALGIAREVKGDCLIA